MIPFEKESTFQGEYLYDESFQSDEHSLSRFCQFVDYYTRYSSDPMFTAAACERQADAVCITPQDLNQETIRLLLTTMLNAIDHLEKKWFDEQLQREEQEQQQRKDPVSRRVVKPQQEKPRLKHIVQTWLQGTGNMLKGGAFYAR